MLRVVMFVLLTSVILISLSVSEALAGESRQDCVAMHKQKRYHRAIKCYQRMQQKKPDDHELHRLIGVAYALMGQRQKAYSSYKTYVEKCPDCMYAPIVSNILADYEELISEDSGEGDSKSVVKDSKRKSSDGAKSSIRATQSARAKALVDKAEALQKVDPKQAMALCLRVLSMVDMNDPSRKKATGLMRKLKSKKSR